MPGNGRGESPASAQRGGGVGPGLDRGLDRVVPVGRDPDGRAGDGDVRVATDGSRRRPWVFDSRWFVRTGAGAPKGATRDWRERSAMLREERSRSTAGATTNGGSRRSRQASRQEQEHRQERRSRETEFEHRRCELRITRGVAALEPDVVGLGRISRPFYTAASSDAGDLGDLLADDWCIGLLDDDSTLREALPLSDQGAADPSRPGGGTCGREPGGPPETPEEESLPVPLRCRVPDGEGKERADGHGEQETCKEPGAKAADGNDDPGDEGACRMPDIHNGG